jgi:hypothetical protein
MRTEGRTQVDLGRSHGADRVIAFNERGSRGSSSLNRNGLIEAIPLDVGLFHEVLHTYHERKGDEAQGSYSGANPLLRNSDGAGTLNWELQVIGLDRWRASGLTENAYRRDRGVSERVSHFSGEVLRRRGVIR